MKRKRNEDPEKVKNRLVLARQARMEKIATTIAKGGVSLRLCLNCNKAVADSYLRKNKECPYCNTMITKVSKLPIAKYGNGEVPNETI
jgi:formamidopyrimidine-DNA glycosylase